MYGKVILFGSGETTESGKAIFRKVLQGLPRGQKISILETPAGFEPNSSLVARKISDIFSFSLKEFISKIDVIPARKKETYYSPDNPDILAPLNDSTFLFMGPGSPTYTIRQLRNSKAWDMILSLWEKGITICLSSAAALASGKFSLPVYEIYKAGVDLYWENGLNLFRKVGLDISIITHWNNKEGGKDLDTRYCFMGKDRFKNLRKLIPSAERLLGIDENTALIFDFRRKIFYIEGVGNVTFLVGNKELIFWKKHEYSIATIMI